MSNAKKAVLSIIATLALALVIGITNEALDLGTNDDQANGPLLMEQMQLAGHEEDEHGGG